MSRRRIDWQTPNPMMMIQSSHMNSLELIKIQARMSCPLEGIRISIE
jgi:hypothetical protein